MEMVRFFLRSCVIGAASMVASLAGCSDNTPPPQKVAVQSHIQPGTGADAAKCQLPSSDWVDIGRIGGTSIPPEGPVVPIESGKGNVSDDPSFNGGSVNISCSVTKSGDGFSVSASAGLGGVAGAGSIAISGTFNASGQQTNINATFVRGDSGQFKVPSGGKGCTVDYQRPDGSGGDPTNQGNGMGVAPGRVWGFLSCPVTENSAQRLTSGGNEQCAFIAEVRFENCAQ
jgi:hypothetical protein